MTRSISTLLTSSEPAVAVPTKVTIGHIQLRDLIICPHEHGVVCYPQQRSIVEHDLLDSSSAPRRVTELGFTPNSLSTLNLQDTNETLLAAGGQDAELHLSLYAPPSQSYLGDDDGSSRDTAMHFGRQRWKSEVSLDGASINNSVLLTSLSLTGSNESSAEPRVVISNNDRTVKFFDVAVRSGRSSDNSLKRLSHAGHLRLDVPVNHSSISPDGRTLLSVGDSPDIYLHRVTGGAHVTFSLMTKLTLEPYITTISPYAYSNAYTPYHTNYPVPASFSTAFSANGSKFAVASQEGVVAVWDVRSTKPLKVIQTDKARSPASPRNEATGMASGWIYDTPWDWGRGQGKAPGWGVRSVKFSPSRAGREVMTFTEHTSLLHVMDARTFEEEEIVRVPNFDSPPPSRPPTARPRSNSPPFARTPETSQSLPPPARIVLFSGVLEDTFRIPSADSTGRRRRSGHPFRTRDEPSGAEEDGDGIVVVPTLGDTELDEDVRRLLDGRHGLHTRVPTLGDTEHDEDSRRLADGRRTRVPNLMERGNGGDERADDIDIDELESDCLSSYAPSRASSPGPSVTSSAQLQDSRPLTAQMSAERTAASVIRRERERTRDPLALRRTSNTPRRHRRHLGAERGADVAVVEAEQDLAGTCFDPSGEYIYVAAVHGVSGWKVRGAEQRWWGSSSLA